LSLGASDANRGKIARIVARHAPFARLETWFARLVKSAARATTSLQRISDLFGIRYS
jgi:hypothetical protein